MSGLIHFLEVARESRGKCMVNGPETKLNLLNIL